MLITTLLFMYGLPFIYQGEEIGMTNVDYEDLDDLEIVLSHLEETYYYTQIKK